MHEAAERLDDEIVAGAAVAGAARPESADASDDGSRVEFVDLGIRELCAVERAGEKVVDHNVGFSHEAASEFNIVRVFEIEGD